MTQFTSFPTEMGWYWRRLDYGSGLVEEEIVFVWHFESEGYVQFVGTDKEKQAGNTFAKKVQWYGPLVSPWKEEKDE